MRPFLERFYSAVEDELGDPGTSKRYTTTKKLQDLNVVNTQVWEQLMDLTLAQSTLYFAECEITLEADKEFYTLPDGFRQFIALVRYDDDRNITGSMGSKQNMEISHGVEILSSTRGFRLRPLPVLSGDQTWTLQYLRGPGHLHYAKVEEFNPTQEALVSVGPANEQAGELILKDDYYNGLELRIYQAAGGAPQTREILKYVAKSKTFILRHAFSPPIEGEAWYEITPCLPEPYDEIFAIDVSQKKLRQRGRLDLAESLLRTRNQHWEAVKKWVLSNSADRGARKVASVQRSDFTPVGIPYPLQGY